MAAETEGGSKKRNIEEEKVAQRPAESVVEVAIDASLHSPIGARRVAPKLKRTDTENTDTDDEELLVQISHEIKEGANPSQDSSSSSPAPKQKPEEKKPE